MAGYAVPSVELVIWNDKQKDNAHNHGQQSCDEEHNLPRLNRGSMDRGASCDTVCQQAAQNLRPAIEGEPDTRSQSLLALRIPLRSDKSEAGRHSGFANTKEEADRHCSAEILDASKAGQYCAPGNDTACRIFANGQDLEKTVCWVFECDVATRSNEMSALYQKQNDMPCD